MNYFKLYLILHLIFFSTIFLYSQDKDLQTDLEIWKKAYIQYKKDLALCKKEVEKINLKSALNKDYLFSEFCSLQIPKVEDPDSFGWVKGVNSMAVLSLDEKDRLNHFLNVKGHLINQLKPGILLTEKDYEVYKEVLYTTNDDFEDFLILKMEHKNIKNGTELLRYISYSHIVSLMMHILKKKNNLKTKLPQDLIYGPKRIEFLGIFDNISQSRKSIETLSESMSPTEQIFSFIPVRKLMQDDIKNKENLINAFLGGILNFDPRVRLFSIYMIRRLIPEVRIWDVINQRVKRILQYENEKSFLNQVNSDDVEETVQYTIYSYQKLDEEKLNAIVYDQIIYLRRFISRFLLLEGIRKSYDLDIISKIAEPLFVLLARPIDGESYCRVPIYYFKDKEEIEALIIGLKGTDNPKIEKELTNALIRIILSQDIDYALRFDTFKKMVQNDFDDFFFKDWKKKSKELLLASDEDLENFFQVYIQKNPQLESCQPWRPDQYDDKAFSKNEEEEFLSFLKKVIPFNEYDYLLALNALYDERKKANQEDKSFKKDLSKKLFILDKKDPIKEILMYEASPSS